MDRAIISAMLDYPLKQKYIVGEIKANEFKSDLCRDIYNTMLSVRRESGVDCDSVLLYKKALELKKQWSINVFDYQNQTPTEAHESAEEMYDRMFNMKFLPAGRGIWTMGRP